MNAVGPDHMKPETAAGNSASGNRPRKFIVMVAAALVIGSPAAAQYGHFPDARETNEELLELYEQASDLCVRNRNRDVQVAVACQAMGIYGMALNERDLCYGKESEANAEAKWHACGTDSLRFPVIELPAGYQ